LLIDEFVPVYQFSERHHIFVPAPPDVVYRALEVWRPESSFLWRWLVRLRGLGAPRGTLRELAAGFGFLCLGETEREVVYGQAGRFWAPNERAALVSPRTAQEFSSLSDPRFAVAAMNFLIEPDASRHGTRLYTETRVCCLGASSRRWFRVYWMVIRPFSGLLRHSMLRGIKAEAGKAEQSRETVGGSKEENARAVG
jgi:hypothetical protein